LDVAGAEKVVAEIEKNGGWVLLVLLNLERLFIQHLGHFSTAISTKCNVTVWEDQVALFDLAMSKYGSVDVVVRL